MMYRYSLTLSAGQTEKTAESVKMKLPPGTITRARFDFPPGCHGLVHVRVLKADSFILPTNPSATIYGDMFPIEGPMKYELEPQETTLKFLGWNEDETHVHKVSVTLWVAKPEENLLKQIFQLLREFIRGL